jgi:Family of unknown function (DUF6266)
MGVLRSGILGHMSGKTAGVVGGKWKDKSYVREYVIPTNPNTTAQQTQRTKFQKAVAFAKPLVGQVFNQYVDKFQKSMSGFNAFISANVSYFGTVYNYASMKIVQGKLWKVAITAATYSTPNVTITWDGASLGNNGTANDHAYAIVYDESTKLFYFAAAEVHRSTGTITVPCVAGLTAGTLFAFLWFAQYSVTSATLLEMVSDNSYHTVS